MPGFGAAVQAIRSAGAVPSVQLAHAGRKADFARPRECGAPLPAVDPNTWRPLSASGVPFIERS